MLYCTLMTFRDTCYFLTYLLAVSLIGRKFQQCEVYFDGVNE